MNVKENCKEVKALVIIVAQINMKMQQEKDLQQIAPNIHITGSVRGMVKLGYWSEDSDKVRNGNYIYQQP